MLSISSWRSGGTSKQQPEVPKPTARRPAAAMKEPSPVVPPPPASTVEGEHRGAVRQSASAVPSITRLSLLPSGAEATLVNISATGLLAECGIPLKTGNLLKVLFEGTFSPQSVEGRVVRSCVSSMTPSGVRYYVGITFKVPIDLESQVTPQSVAADSPAPVAVAERPQPVLVNRW